MCTDICPCAPGEANYNFEWWSALGDKILEKYGRSKEKSPLKWQKHAFTTYKDCYDKVLKAAITSNDKYLVVDHKKD